MRIAQGNILQGRTSEHPPDDSFDGARFFLRMRIQRMSFSSIDRRRYPVIHGCPHIIPASHSIEVSENHLEKNKATGSIQPVLFQLVVQWHCSPAEGESTEGEE